LKADPVTAKLPIILFEKAPKKKIVDLAFQELSALSLHWQNDLEEISNDLKNKFAIQGNLNPKILLESDEIIWSETQDICRLMQNYPGFIFNLGHGITPDINPGKVQVMIDAIRS
jgi:uroporphyrinogen decarboxylase